MHIFPEDQVDENFFDLYYHPYKKQIWGVGTLLAIVVVGFLGFRQIRQSRLDDQWLRYRDALSMPLAQAPQQGLPAQADPSLVARRVAALEALAEEHPEADVAPWALKAVIDAHLAAEQMAKAKSALERLEQRYPDFALNSLAGGSAEGTRSLADQLRASIESELQWEEATRYEHRAPSETRTALIDTSLGTLQIGFYADEAPDHVAAFVERAKSGAYNGTQIYEIRLAADGSPQLVRGGSPASKAERDPALHDRDEPTDTIEPEDSRFLIRHRFGVISSVEMESGESASSFQVITAQDGMSRFDGQNTPFAAVLDRPASLETLQKLARAPTYGTNPDTAREDGVLRMRDHPYPPILIRRVAILADEQVEDGHTWDTSRIGTDAPEPWEAELAEAPLPSEFVTPASDDDGSKESSSPDDEGSDDEAEAEDDDQE